MVKCTKTNPTESPEMAELTQSQLEMSRNIGNPDYWRSRLSDESDQEALCNDWLGLYMVAGAETKRIMKEMIDDRFEHFEKVITDSIQGLEHDHKKLERRRIEDREIIDKHESEIQSIRQSIAHQANVSDQTLAMVRMTHDSVNNLSDVVTSSLNLTAAKTSTWISKIPIPAWIAMSVAVIGVIALLTGHFAEFAQALRGSPK